MNHNLFNFVHPQNRGNRQSSFLPYSLLLFLALLIFSVPVQANNIIIVNSFADDLTAEDGFCTLREAVINANTDADATGGDCAPGSGADTIDLAAGTYALSLVGSGPTAGDLNLWGEITIQGADAATTIIDASAAEDRVFSVSGTATISSVTITGGDTPWGGGGIAIAEAELLLKDSIVSGNRTDDAGGGIYINTGEITINDSIIANNEATDSGGGLIVDGYYSTATINRSTFESNATNAQGGGISSTGGSVELSQSALNNNTALVGGGGIYNTNAGYAVISDSAISNNEVGTGSFSSNKFGGGIKNEGGDTSMSVTNSTISGNKTADDGGGIYNNSSNINLLNVTLVDNIAISQAGGIDNFGYVTVENSIIAGNTSALAPADCRSLFGWPLTSYGYNLFGAGTGCTPANTDLTVAPADVFTTVLDVLQDNGGPTATHALLVDSPALDNANDEVCPTADQRGTARPQFAACDIGAFEAEDFPQTGPTFTVNVEGDFDDGVCSFTDCSLREAIDASNNGEGTDTIVFDVPETYLVFIYPDSALPEITDPVTIDGYAGTNYVILDGSEMETAVSGLTISAGSSTVRGIAINNFGAHGILLVENGGNTIDSVEIYGNGGDGIRVLDGTNNTLTTSNISDNGGLAIDLDGDGVTPNDANDPDTGANNLTNTPVIIRAVPNDDEILVEGYLNGEPNTSYVIEFFNNTSCDASGYGEGDYFLNSDEVTTNANGNIQFSTYLYDEGQDGGFDTFSTSFVTATATDENGNTSEFSKCDPTSLGNDSWPRALNLELIPDAVSPEVMTATVKQLIDKQDQSRWFKFQVQPDSQLMVTLTNLPKNYDLTVYKDIGETYNDLLNVNNNDDLIQLGAEFAPDAFSPDAFSPDAFSPDAFSPDAFSPDAFSPDAFSPDIFSPDAFSPDAFSPDAFSPDAFSPDAFSPDAFSPDAFSPDAFSPDAFSPDAFSPDAFSSAQTRSLLAVSAFNGTAGEGVLLNTWDNDGTFYVRVRGRNGAFSLTDTFQLDVTMTTGNCSAVSTNLPAATHAATAGGYNTIILTDNGRLQGTPAEIATLQARLATLATRPEVNAVIVDLSSEARIVAANAQADSLPTCPFAKNLVARATRQLINEYRALNPIEYIVLVGNDDVIPFFRHPDQALLANERNYVPPVRDNTASQASLKKGYLLSQDFYGATKSISSRSNRLPIPDVPVGRLVETATDITAYLDAYLATANGVITPNSALITGYDFLEDSALAVTAELEAGIGTNATTLITARDVSPTDPASWTADQLKAELLNNRFDISFLAGHFSASSALAADYSTRLLASEVAASPVDMTNTLFFSAGCHSGYNIVNAHDVTNITPEPDWAQAFAQKGATLIAGTGYQYGDTDFIEYSERLYLQFSENLREGTGPVPIGKAFVEAKQEYLAETAELRPLHEKSLLISTIFGLPMLSVDMPAGRTTPTGDSSIVSSTTTFGTNPGATLGLEFADVTVNSSLDTNQIPLDVLGDEGATVDATYITGSNGLVINPAEPMLPLERRNVNVPGQVLRGVGFRGGAFTDVGGILPLTGAATTEIRGVHPPFVSDTFYPVQPWQVNYFDALLGGDIRLDVFPAQYRSDSAISPTGTMRQFSNMDFRLYYSNYTTKSQISGNSPALAAPPSISSITAEVDDGEVTFSVRVVGDPAAGIQEVWLVYSGNGPFAGQWQPLDLTQDANDSTLWQGTLSLNGATNVYYFVQAANGVGLVSAITNLGDYYRVTDDGVPVPPEPEPTEISLQNPPTSGAYSTVATASAVLTSNGTPLANQPVRFGLGAQQKVVLTDENGLATAKAALLGSPGPATLQVGFGGNEFYLPSSDSSPFTITKQATDLMLTPENGTAVFEQDSGVFATLMDAAERPFNEKTVIFQVSGDNGSYTTAAITDFNGRAFLGTVPLPPGTYTVKAAFGSVITLPNQTLDLTDDRYMPSTATGTLVIEEPAANELVYLSLGLTTKIDGMWISNEDVFAYNLSTETWEKVFDGSDVGLFTANVNSFAKLDDGTFLMTFGRTRYIRHVGKVYRNDIVRFIPTSLGEQTAGTFELFFDGSDVGLNSAAETIDAVGVDENGRLLISTFNAFNINGLRGKGADILAFTPDTLGKHTSGSWELYFDGSDVGLGRRTFEGINGLWVDSDNTLYLTTLGKFKINNDFQGRGSDIFICDADSLGSDTSCDYSFFWKGSDYGIHHNAIDALWIE